MWQNLQADLLHIFSTMEAFIWGWPMLALLVPTGIYLTFLLKGLQFRLLFHSLRLAFGKKGQASDADHQGDISHFQALMTALSATVGTGNIAGVATAIAVGGPGALIWMWLTGFLGMATKYTEAVLGVYYRHKNSEGEMSGGPMWYITEGLGAFSFFRKTYLNRILAALFAILLAVGALNLGNMVQSNSVADVMHTSFGVPFAATGVVLAILTALVILGGIKRIGRVTSTLVPFMIVLYLASGSVVLIDNAAMLPGAFRMIIDGAFNGTGAAAVGGFAGAAVKEVMAQGLSRGVFSNESGLGSSPIAAAAAKTKHPVEQAMVSMTQTFIDTIVVCTFTALIIIVSGLWGMENGASLTASAFASSLTTEGGLAYGNYVVAICLVFFAYSTLLGWSYYGEKAIGYLTGERPMAIKAYKVVFILFVMMGAVAKLPLVWSIAAVFTGLMLLPNLVALIALSPLVARLTNDYFENERTGEGYRIKPFHRLYDDEPV